ncbi:hypothetical protein [Patulibacter minatonensis]|uniref:hypothetical protein n=1 Tax=Patulibacter minatonensis TaxID=298163 RepID=UPI0012FAB4D1|nr:hypothetical protein [Patulibacter minatonensis]
MQTIDTFDLVLEKRGRSDEISPEQREATAAYAESQGYERAARRIREHNARRYGFGRPQLQAAPEDARRPLKSNGDRPILVALDGWAEAEFDPERSWWNDVGRICERHDPRFLSLPGRLFREALVRAHSRHGA